MTASEPLHRLVAFVPSTNLDLAREFYRDILELPLVSSDDYAVVLSSGSTHVRVTAVPNFAPHPFTVLGWVVTDIGDTIASLAERGVEFLRFDGMEQDDSGVWVAPGGAQIAWFCDPDDNILSITQLT